MKNKKLIVYDFFGGLNNSILKGLDKKLYKVFTFDIREKSKDGNKNIVLDMTTNIKDILKNIKKLELPKPDIVVGSPMCNSFSIARRYKDGAVGGWVINKKDNTLQYRSKQSWNKNKSTKRNDKWEGIEERRHLGKMGIENMVKIIKHFKPKVWYIENPKNSLMWNYVDNNLKFKGYKNVGRYSSYGFHTRKDTTFLSNIKLNLKVDNENKPTTNLNSLDRKDRSDIPQGIIKDIFKQFRKEIL